GGHFYEIQKLCERSGVGFRVKTSEELAQFYLRVLTEEGFLDNVQDRTTELLDRERGALQRTVSPLATVLDGIVD
ncbi:MAG: hypothetical protein QOJ65_1693, partial [Fimbriimonadaceae bacterium]|nr:hypothetical protein [Fimbriimonadaceae bacterium]